MSADLRLKESNYNERFMNFTKSPLNSSIKPLYFFEIDMRCLDCRSADVDIEMIDSPISFEQKRILRLLMRKSFKNQ